MTRTGNLSVIARMAGALALMLLAGAELCADCQTTVDTSLAGRILTVNASSTGACDNAGSTILVTLDGAEIGRNTCAATSCSTTLQVDTGCLTAGPHQVVAYGGCGRINTDPQGVQSCGADTPTSASTTFSVNNKPTVAIRYTPPPEGSTEGRVYIDYVFPAGSGTMQFWLDDAVQLYGTFPEHGTWDFPFYEECRPSGPHTLKVTAQNCGGWSDEDETGIVIDNKPKLSLSPHPDGGYFIHVRFRGSGAVVILHDDVFVQAATFAWSATWPRGFPSTPGVKVRVAAVGCIDTVERKINSSPDDYSCPIGAGKPINVGSGDVALSLPLFTLDDPVLPLSFALDYHSEEKWHRPLTGELAPGWTHTFSETLRPTEPDRTYLYRVSPGGHQTFYRAAGAGHWVSAFPGELREDVTEAGLTYRLADLDGTVKVFSRDDGQWLSTTDRWGNTITATYSGNGLATVTDARGRQIVFSRQAGLLSAVTLPTGETWRFEHAGGNLAKIFDPVHDGSLPWRTFSYVNDYQGEPRLLTGMWDEAGVLLEGHAYDIRDRGVSSYSEGGRESVTVQYNTPAPGMSRVTHDAGDGLQQVSDFTLGWQKGRYLATRIDGICPTCGGWSDSELLEYDASNHVTKRTDGRGVVTNFTYDGNGNILTRTEALGRPEQRTATFVYADPRLPRFATRVTEPAPNGNRITDSSWNGNETVLTVDVTGKLDAGAPSPVTFTTVSQFDARHRLLTIDGPRTDVADVLTRSYHPDDDPDFEQRGRLASVENAAGHTSSYTGYDVFGTPRSATDPNGVVTELETDPRGRITASISVGVAGDPQDAANLRSTRTWDGRDRLVETMQPRGNRTRYAYENGSNELTDTTRLDLAGSEVERRHLTLNGLGRTTAEELQELQVCSSPAPVCTQWVTRRRQTFTYDIRNRLKEVVHDDGEKIVYAYDENGQVSGVRDENHSSPNTSYEYDPLGRLKTVTQTLGAGTAITRYGYDAQDNLTSVTDPNGNVTQYSFDDFGRMIRQVSPVTGLTAYSYDPAGNLLSTTDANGASTARAYDAVGRVLSSVSSRPSFATESVQWTYDGASPFGIGRTASMTDPAGATTYAYDRRGLLRREVRTFGSSSYTTAFACDANGNRRSITYPSGRVVDYGFDFADRAVSAVTGSQVLVSSAEYLPFGPVTRLVYGNGTTRTVGYDTRYRVEENKLTRGSTPVAWYDYDHDPAGNITAITDLVSAGYSRTFGYDDLNRLTGASGGASLWGAGSYDYDAMGNLLSLSLGSFRSATLSYAGTTPKRTSITDDGVVRPVSYDAAGNELAVGASTYAYSARNVLSAAGSISFLHDGRGVPVVSDEAIVLSSVSILPSSVSGGSDATGTVTLSADAPIDLTVVLSSSDSAAGVPASVVVPAGAVSASFTVTTSAVSAAMTATITATLDSSIRSASLEIRPAELAGITVAPGTVPGGIAATGTVTLDGLAPAGGVTVSLASSSSAGSVPSAITVSSGTNSATFTVTTSAVSSDVNVTLTATLRTVEKNTSLLVSTPVLTSFTVTPASVTGGNRATAEASLSGPTAAGGASVSVSTTNTSVVPTLAPVSIPAGTASGQTQVATASVASSTLVVLSGTSNGVTRAATLTVEPVPVTIASLTFNPASLVGSNDATGAVTLSAPAPAGGVQIELLSSDSAVLRVPALVSIDAWATQAAFPIETSLVAATTSPTVTAWLGVGSRPAPITVQAAAGNHVTSLTIAPGAVAGGTQATGTVILKTAATTGSGIDVLLSSSNTAVATVPVKVTVKKNRDRETFIVTTSSVTTPSVATISATFGGVVQRFPLPVLLPANTVTMASVTLQPTRVTGGNGATGTVTLTGAAPAGGALVTLGGSRLNVATVPASAVVPAGATSVTFVVATDPNYESHDRPVDVSAAYNGVTKTAKLLVAPSPHASLLREPVARCASASIVPCLTAAGLGPVATTLPRRQRYSFYSAEFTLLAESALSASATKPIEYEYVWFAGQPLAQIETATGAIHWYLDDHLGTPLLTTDVTGTVDWRVEREPYGTIFDVRAGADRHQPLGFPGQVEVPGTDLVANVLRFYRPRFGTFTQVDPVGWDSPWSRTRQRTFLPNLFQGFDTGAAYVYGLGSPVNVIDPTGETAFGAALPLAGGCVLADGPFPIGDVIALTILTGAVIYDLTRPKEVTCSSCEPKKKQPWTCTAQCNTQVFKPEPGITYPPRLTGIGYGHSEAVACTSAKAAATGSAPPGSYGRHCKCTACWKN